MPFFSPLLLRALQATLLFLFISFQGVAQAPPFAWAKQAGGSSFDTGRGIAVDSNGNSYITGDFQGTATFGSTTFSSNSYQDIFIAKYDASGNVLWAKKAGGNGADNSFDIAADASGNSYVTGFFRDFATFGSITLSSNGSFDNIFIVKYDPSGNVLWAKKAGGTSGQGQDVGQSIAVDSSGNSYVTGYFYGTATFDNITLTSSGFSDVFIAKYDVSGNVLWAKKAGGTYSDSGYGIAVDSSGNSYITGGFNRTATFGGTTLTASSIDYYDVFIAKYDASGNVLWAKKAGGTSYDFGQSIAVDGSGNSYVTGYVMSTATFGSITFSSSGFFDFNVFIAKYDASGNVLWAQKAGGTGEDDGNGIAVDGSGYCYVTGAFQNSVTFGSTTLASSSSDTSDVFIVKYDASGNVLWAQKAGGTGSDYGSGIAVDNSGYCYVTGAFQDDANFGSITIINNGGYYNDVFICKLGFTTHLVSADACEQEPVPFSINPLPANTTAQWDFGDPSSGPDNIATGATVNHTYSSQGVYYATVTTTATGSPVTLNATVQIYPKPVLSLPSGVDICPDNPNPLILATTPLVLQTYLWSTGATTPSISIFQPGTYWLRVTSPKGCVTTDTVQVLETTRPPVLGADTALCLATPFLLTSFHVFDYYRWSTGETTPSISITAPGTYALEANYRGCLFQDTITITEQCEFLIPNIITPNGDSRNDAFSIRGRERNALDLQIFNRWGQKVYDQTAYRNTWSGEDLPDGIYYYLLHDQTSNTDYKGYIELSRNE